MDGSHPRVFRLGTRADGVTRPRRCRDDDRIALHDAADRLLLKGIKGEWIPETKAVEKRCVHRCLVYHTGWKGEMSRARRQNPLAFMRESVMDGCRGLPRTCRKSGPGRGPEPGGDAWGPQRPRAGPSMPPPGGPSRP